MSSSSSNTSSASAGRAFCKVCRDAGRPESEYTSHFVKDQPGPNGKVVCPMLLNQACRICHNTGHTSSYCSQYRSRREEPRREEPRRDYHRREERYIEREEPRRDYPRREERYIEREEPRRDYRREERYIEREEPRRDISFNHLRDDTERREREIRDRDESYQREQDRRAKPWLQAALKPASAARNAPYAHPHGPRVRLNLESNALCASKHAISSPEENQENSRLAIEAVRNVVVKLNHAANWGDEDAEEPFVCDPEQMFREFEAEFRTTSEEHDFIEECDDQSEMPFACGY
jgi:hypothetical protein